MSGSPLPRSNKIWQVGGCVTPILEFQTRDTSCDVSGALPGKSELIPNKNAKTRETF